MTTSKFEDTMLEPLTTDELIEKRVEALVGRACRRQLWFLFLDDQNVQLPLLIPMSDPPSRPDASVSNVARLVEDAVEAEGASSVIVVLERYADSTLTVGDKAWARAIHEAFDEYGVVLRGFFISHRRGVSWVPTEDYRAPML